jgi:hypothetical protein
LQVLNKRKRIIRYAIVIVWLISIVVAFSYFMQARLVAFDPNHQLGRLTAEEIIQHVKADGLVTENNMLNSVIHFNKKGCICSKLNEQHKKEININAQQAGFHIIDVQMTEKLMSVIPSTPAALIIDQHGQLVYFGPYAEGLGCSSSNGLIDTVLANYRKGFNARMIVDDAVGCYCHST